MTAIKICYYIATMLSPAQSTMPAGCPGSFVDPRDDTGLDWRYAGKLSC